MMLPRYLELIRTVLQKSMPLGFRTLPNGSKLVGHVPHVAPQAFLHLTFPGLREDTTKLLEESLGIKFPDDLKLFYSYFNGFSLFSDCLSAYGHRVASSRSPDSLFSPYSLITPNVKERPFNSTQKMIFWAGYGWDGSLVYINIDSQKIFRCSRDDANPLNEWLNLDEMLVSEINRISKLFDEKGRKLQSDLPTVPK